MVFGHPGEHLDAFLHSFMQQSCAICMPNLLVEPQHRARHSDVSQADPLPHQEGTSVEVLVQHCEGPFHVFLGLLCGLDRPRQEDENAKLQHELCYMAKCQP